MPSAGSQEPQFESAQKLALRSARRAGSYLEAHGYRGYDPYDALTSPLFAVPLLSRSRTVRRATQQLVKRCPLNVRPLIGIRKGYNPVTLALALAGYAYLHDADPERSEHYRERALWCVGEIDRLQATGYSGASWGYDFDWQTRESLIRAHAPTIVATGFVTNGLFQAYERLGIPAALDLCRSACDFIRKDVPYSVDAEDRICWSYSPFARNQILNATMKGARLCAQVYSATKDEELLTLAQRSARFVAAHQEPDGSWPYAIDDARAWVDNFHTGYLLDCLAEYQERTGDRQFHAETERGWRFYRAAFIGPDGRPRYFPDREYPIDATACAQSILTLCAFRDVAAGDRVAAWTIANMQLPDGSFTYQVWRLYTNRIVYTRWSVAWMFCALARLASPVTRN